jgi:accessory gene regulator protein AgrB
MLDRKQREVISYGVSVLISNILGLAGVLLIAYIFGVLIPTLAILIVLLILRPNAGGAHCSSSFNCNLFGYAFIPLFGFIAFWLSRYSPFTKNICLTICSIAGITWLTLKAPYFFQSKPRAEARNKKLKTRAITLAISFFFAALIFRVFSKDEWAMGIAVGLLFQGFMLSSLGIKVIQSLDKIVNRTILLKKGGEIK